MPGAVTLPHSMRMNSSIGSTLISRACASSGRSPSGSPAATSDRERWRRWIRLWRRWARLWLLDQWNDEDHIGLIFRGPPEYCPWLESTIIVQVRANAPDYALP